MWCKGMRRKLKETPYRILNVDDGYSKRQTFFKIDSKTGKIRFPYSKSKCKKCGNHYFFMNRSDVVKKCPSKKCNGNLEKLK